MVEPKIDQFLRRAFGIVALPDDYIAHSLPSTWMEGESWATPRHNDE